MKLQNNKIKSENFAAISTRHVAKLSVLASNLSLSCKSAVLCLTALAAFATSAQANLVQNGGFEQISNNQSMRIGPIRSDQEVIGWTHEQSGGGSQVGCCDSVYLPGTADTTGAQGHYLYGPGNGVNNGLTPTSPAGGNFVALDGDVVARATFSQTINGLTPGQSYELSFYYAAAQLFAAGGHMPDGPTTSLFQVGLGSETQTTPGLSIEGHGFSGWQNVTMNFTANSASEVLSFLAIGTPSGQPPMALLDGVSLTEVPLAPVPEPASLVLLGAGLAGLGFARLRRKSANPPTADKA